MPMILVIDDDPEMLKLVETYLRLHSYAAVTARSGPESLKLAYQTRPDLVLLDIAMPGLDGLTVCNRLREATDTPILILSGRTDKKVVVEALEQGADDYITKPFEMKELLARIKAWLRRTRTWANPDAALVTVGNVIIDLMRHQVLVDGQEVDLTPLEFKVLACLAEQQGEIVSHQTLLREVWGTEYIDQVAYLRIYIGHLRRKLEADPDEPRIILNQRGVGYYLADA